MPDEVTPTPGIVPDPTLNSIINAAMVETGAMLEAIAPPVAGVDPAIDPDRVHIAVRNEGVVPFLIEAAITTDPVHPPVAASPPEMVKGCQINEVLSRSEIELLKLAPLNETVRALVLAKTSIALPANMGDFDQIKAHIEANAMVPKVRGIKIPVTVREDRHGRCRFRGDFAGGGDVHLRAPEISALLDGCDSWADFVDAVSGYVRNMSIDIELQPSNLIYAAYTHEASGDTEVDYNRTALEQQLRAFMAENHPDAFEYDDESD